MRPLLLIFILQLGIVGLTAQRPSAQTPTGRIIFTDREVPASQLTAQKGLQQYTLTNNSNLFISVSMDHSLRQDLHRVAPNLNLDSLTTGGYTKDAGYQFTLFVDHTLIYKSDIWTPTRDIKTTATVLTQPLLDYQHEGASWSQWFWIRFSHSGGDSALTDGPHQLRLEIRSYVRVGKDTLSGKLLAAGDLKMQVQRKVAVDVSKVRLSPIQPYEGFGISRDGYDSNKIKLMKGLIDAGVFKHISSVVVIKDGNILIEEYFNGEGRDSLHDPRSVGKSFASTMTGMAIRDGYLKTADQPLADFYQLKNYANYLPEKDSVKLKDLLSMCSAFDGDDDDGNSPGNEDNMYDKENWVKWTLDLPLSATRPRDRWHYFTAGAMLMGDILNSSVRGGLDAYADLKLFSPLGIRDYQWQYTPQHVANTAGGIRLKALDFAKYGQLYKNGGQWQGHQVLPAEWVKTTFTKYHELPGRPNEYYGYFFWNKTYHVDAKSCETWYCAGNGGNHICVFTDQPLVIVVTATAYGMPYAHSQVDKMMTDYILPAVLEN
jgi:CubicO group peptidase (beta-lactamase class C family)